MAKTYVNCRVLGVALFEFVFLFGLSCSIALSEENNAPPADFFDRKVLGQGPIQYVLCELKNARSGQLRTITVLLQNTGPKSVELQSVTTSCACTKATVPKKTLRPGDTERLDFEIKLSDNPMTLFDNFDASIKATGQYQLIHVRFIARYEELVTFGRKDMVHTYGSGEKDSTFTLPLKCTDLKLLRGAKIVTSSEILKVSGAIVIGKEDAKVVLKFLPKDLPETDVAGEIRIERENEVLASIMCLFQGRKEVELLPKQILFATTVGEDSKAESSATAILRFRETGTDHSVECRSISCASEDGHSFDTTFVRMAAGRFRVNIKTANREDVPKNGSLVWTIQTSQGKISLVSKYSFLN